MPLELTNHIGKCYEHQGSMMRYKLQIRDRVTIRIESMAFGGAGVGRSNNIVVFVPFGAPQDDLEIEITARKKNFARGRILEIIKPSPLRVKPLCGYYGKCGGCCYQHLRYDEQLRIKKQQISDAFRRIGKIAAPPVADVHASPVCYHYRGKAQFHRLTSADGLRLGLMDTSGGRIVDIARCEIMEETINEKINRLRSNNLKANGAENDVVIWSGLPDAEIAGNRQIRRVVREQDFLVPAGGFFQANLFLTDALVEEVCRLAAQSRIRTAIDAYCGCGLFALFLAPFAERIIGVELNEQAIKFARLNAEKQNIQNSEFIQGDVENAFAGALSGEKAKIDLIILDPPRTGCSAALLKNIAGLESGRVIYISCNPATQARDVRILAESGYSLQHIRPFDMFPQTQHIEVVALLVRDG